MLISKYVNVSHKLKLWSVREWRAYKSHWANNKPNLRLGDLFVEGTVVPMRIGPLRVGEYKDEVRFGARVHGGLVGSRHDH